MSNLNDAIDLKQFKDILKYNIENNKELVKKGIAPIALGLEADAGIGKTSVIEEVARELGMTYVKLSLSELEEPGDLTGFPITEYLVKKDKGNGEISQGWVTEKVLQTFTQKGYVVTNRTRLAYAPPAWLPEYNPNGCILNLDDYSRASSVFLQATMELINTGRTVSWALPKGTTIALTSNPDNGQYNVNSLDDAQQTRFLNFKVEFNLDVWAVWAERFGLDNRAINFALTSPEIFTKKNSKNKPILNARSYVMFCNAISGLKNWENPKSLALIRLISKGAFDDDNEGFSSLFTLFIQQRLDKLTSPKEILYGEWSEVRRDMENNLYRDGEFLPSVSSVLSTRILNYAEYMFSKGEPTKPIEERLIQIMENPVMLLATDNIFHIIRSLVTKYRTRCNRLMMNSKIQEELAR